MEILVHCIFPLGPFQAAAGPFVFFCLGCLKGRKLKLLEDRGFSHLLLESELPEEIMLDVWEEKGKRCLYFKLEEINGDFFKPERSVNWRVLIALAAPWRGVEANGLLRKARPLSIQNTAAVCSAETESLHFKDLWGCNFGQLRVTTVGWRLGQSLQILCMIWEWGRKGCKREETDGDEVFLPSWRDRDLVKFNFI